MGRNDCGASCHGESFDGASCLWGEFQWGEWSGNRRLQVPTMRSKDVILQAKGDHLGRVHSD
jgi:hypothetical protein